jgi:hypothetical protein
MEIKRLRHYQGGYMKNIYLILVVSILTFGCSTMKMVPFHITSEPTGCPIEVNGIASGETPTTITLGASRYWVGLLYGKGGYSYYQNTYQVTCLPQKNATEELISQTKTINPAMTLEGAKIHFDLSLQPINPLQRIEIQSPKGKKSSQDNEKTNTDPETKLKKLNKMRDDKIITEEEYQKKRKQILQEY